MRLTLGRLLRLIGLFLLTRGVRRVDARAPKTEDRAYGLHLLGVGPPLHCLRVN
jgi:hypothetical protein